MNLVRIDIVTALRANAAFQALAGDRIYFGAAPSDAAFPFVVYGIDKTERPMSHNQRDSSTTRKADKYTIGMTVYSLSGENAIAVAEAIDNALDGRRDLQNTLLILLEDMTAGAALRDDESEQIIFSAPVTLFAWRKPIA